MFLYTMIRRAESDTQNIKTMSIDADIACLAFGSSNLRGAQSVRHFGSLDRQADLAQWAAVAHAIAFDVILFDPIGRGGGTT